MLYDERHAPRLLDRLTALLATTREPGDMGTLLASAVERGLHLADPRLALEVARHWAHSPDRDSDVEQLVTTALATATSNPGYLDLEVWFHAGLRPPESTHTYRYQLHRLPGAS